MTKETSVYDYKTERHTGAAWKQRSGTQGGPRSGKRLSSEGTQTSIFYAEPWMLPSTRVHGHVLITPQTPAG